MLMFCLLSLKFKYQMFFSVTFLEGEKAFLSFQCHGNFSPKSDYFKNAMCGGKVYNRNSFTALIIAIPAKLYTWLSGQIIEN